jgi:hypothetical protein
MWETHFGTRLAGFFNQLLLSRVRVDIECTHVRGDLPL